MTEENVNEIRFRLILHSPRYMFDIDRIYPSN